MHPKNTSVTDLAGAILENVVAPLPAIDIHTHIRPRTPPADDLGDILFYHYIVAELLTCGIDRERIERAASSAERIALFAAEQHRISNSVTSWCLRRVLEGLGMEPGAPLTAQALTDLDQKFRAASSGDDWVRKVLERQEIRFTFLTLNILDELPDFDPALFAGTLRLDDLVAGISAEPLKALEAKGRSGIEHLNAFERTAGELMNAFAASGGVAVTVGMPPEEDFIPVVRPEADKLFAEVRGGGDLELRDRAALHSYLLEGFVRLASELGLPVQILLGVRRPLPGGAAVPVVHPDLATRFAPLFHRYREVSFDLLLSSVAHSQELIAVAKNYPNVSLSGHWWYAFSPAYIRSMLTERLLALPAGKLHGFFSDAYNIEWSAGKLALFRAELARVLAELILSGYLSESQAPDVARALLYDNPQRFYGLDRRRHERPAQASPEATAPTRI